MKSVFVSVQPRNADFFLQGSGLRPHNISIILPLEKEPLPRRAGANAAVAALAQASRKCTFAQLAGVSPSPQCRLRAEVTRQRRRKEHEMAEIEKRHHLHIVLTPRQYRLLCSQAKQCRLTKRAYLASLIEGQPVNSLPRQEIKAL